MKYISNRVVNIVPILFLITVATFLMMNAAPGSPADMYLDPNAPPEVRAARERALGLDQPIHLRYIAWIGEILNGSLGYSMSNGRPVTTIIAERLGPSLLLAGTALGIGLLFAFIGGIFAAYRSGSLADRVLGGIALAGISIPPYVFGLAGIVIFSVWWQILPSSGRGSGLSTIQHLILPATTLAMSVAGVLFRYVRSAYLEVQSQPYLRTATAKGMGMLHQILQHAAPGTVGSLVHAVALQTAVLLGGSVVVEQIFSWPGVGTLLYDSILSRDYSVVMGVVLVYAVMVLALNLLADVFQAIIDPRIRK